MEVLEAAASEAFLMRLIRFLRRRYAAAVNHLDDHSLEAGVRVAVARARGYGLKWESSLAIFVTATFVVGDDFDQYPPIRQILTDHSIPPDTRVYLLRERITEGEWGQARKMLRLIAAAEAK
ncbi:MAG TPA: hypothetical protein VGV59_05390 [Pyrinomonadaceae bacterium]|nr:hypothetical protein [Pyrinomonadaceae bacterium]